MGSSVSRLPSASQVLIPAIITMAQAFVGKFKLASQENFDEYMKAIGVGMAKRALAHAATPAVTYELNGNEITITTTSMKDYVSKYTIGVEAEEETLDGRKTMSIFSVEGSKLVKKESWDGKPATLTYGLVVTIQLDSITCVRKYTRM